MIVTFEEKYLQALYECGKNIDKKHRFQPEIINRYRICIDRLIAAKNVDVLRTINSLNYEVLKGDKAGISSIRINKQYRIEFTVRNSGTTPIISVCNILELSNHYK